jgi:hypothetical protein
MQPVIAITTYRGGHKVVSQFQTIGQMLDYAREEIKWENTMRVQCKEYDLDLKGDFANFTPTN